MNTYFPHVVVDRAAERSFRRRAVQAYPNEMMETLWGRVVGDTLYIHLFMPIEHKGNPTTVAYAEHDLTDQEDEAEEHKLELLGTIHSHPDCLDALFSYGDLQDIQDKTDLIMGICAVTQEFSQGKKRRNCEIAYWPCPHPMRVTYSTKRKGTK